MISPTPLHFKGLSFAKDEDKIKVKLGKIENMICSGKTKSKPNTTVVKNGVTKRINTIT